jgi:amino acid transporter
MTNGSSQSSGVQILIDEKDEPPNDAGIQVVGLLKFVFLAFFLTCGGPYGIEDAVGAAGPLITLCAFVVLPIIWAVPQALMTAEMATMMAENGGYVVWVQRAFGDFLGWVNAYDRLFCNIFDLALYPVIIVDYLASVTTLSPVEKYTLKVAIVLAVAVLNAYGLELLGTVSAVLTVILLFPFFIELGYVLVEPQLAQATNRWLDMPAEVNWGLFTSTMLWSYTGWDSLGTFAAEVQDPTRTYPLGILFVLILCSVNYLLPVMVGYLMFPETANWTSGTFAVIGSRIGTWLGSYMTLGAIISCFGEVNCELASTARALWAMGIPEGSARKVPACFGFTWRRYNTPLVAIVGIAGTMCGLVFFDFSFLVQVDTFLSCITLLFEFAAFMTLKYREPDAPRPYVVPGGIMGAWIITVPMACVVMFTLFWSNHLIALVSLAINVLVIASYFARRLVADSFTSTGDIYFPIPEANSPATALITKDDIEHPNGHINGTAHSNGNSHSKLNGRSHENGYVNTQKRTTHDGEPDEATPFIAN